MGIVILSLTKNVTECEVYLKSAKEAADAQQSRADIQPKNDKYEEFNIIHEVICYYQPLLF